MGTIVKFAPSQTSEQMKENHGATITAGEIILFPGVRYERDAEEQKQKTPQYNTKTERDFLFL